MKILSRYSIKGFTLVELVVSISILMIVVWIVWITLINVSDSIKNTSIDKNIFDDVNDFLANSYNFNYSSWKIITWTWYNDALFLYNLWIWWVVVWSFDNKNNSNNNYTISINDWKYNKKYFWYFFINKDKIVSFLNDNSRFFSQKFNDGKIYNNIILKNITFSQWNNYLFYISMEIFREFLADYSWQLIDKILIPQDNYIKINLNL